MKHYKIYEVPNGRLQQFVKNGYVGEGWPDACKLMGDCDTVEQAREVFLTLAKQSASEESDREDGLNSRLFCAALSCGLSDDDANEVADAGCSSYNMARVLRAIEGDPSEWSFDLGDLKYLRVLVVDD